MILGSSKCTKSGDEPLFPGEPRAQRDPLVYVHLTQPRSDWNWFVTEFDGPDTVFGLVAGFEVELGSFDRSELEASGCVLDTRWEPKTLSQVRRVRAR